MEGWTRYRASLREKTAVLWLCCALFYLAAAKSNDHHGHPAMSVSASHLYYTCPEGANATLVCNQRGGALHPNDSLWRLWFFTPHKDQHCTKHGPRNVTFKHSKLSSGLHFGATQENFWVQLQNVTHADQGRYCCAALEIESIHHEAVQRTHSHMFLNIIPRGTGSPNCTVSAPSAPEGTVPVALAMGACILALLSLPLILLLVYRQRQSAQSRRRAQELVRMDSEAHGHENPVFLGGSPQIKNRTVSQIMARQSSETGRHLLSEPGTPLSPPAHGDVFFPAEDTIFETPELRQV
ncbi:V-type immunoglobulin domain-containing suppressor of T-cell activation [Takifugu flavidus]|uniref:V-type immunoglobulin domain-containing suppressor of T-cell activation n=1 Tax=Takifugu flavidus TaxID=433684 RepID=UPI00254450B8|nr:V-type immunoglobulin domain-containing suppressor of T-cell activation [Takifugu flavidus]